MMPAAPPPSPKPIRVFIVEDDFETQKRFATAIGSDVRTQLAGTASAGRPAIEALGRECPDVLLVDLGLPDISGLEVIRHAARTLAEADIMVITMFGDEAHVLSSIEAG